jgi:hypothetical protein
MDDIVYRLRNWVIAVHAPPVSDLLDEAADEIDRLRQVSSQQTLTLTDEERAAIAWAAGLSDTRPSGCRTTLRSLLERASKSTADVRENDQ